MKSLFTKFAEVLADEIKKRLFSVDAIVAILRLQVSDTIVLKTKEHLRIDEIENLVNTASIMFPGHKIVVLEEGMDISVVRNDPNPS